MGFGFIHNKAGAADAGVSMIADCLVQAGSTSVAKKANARQLVKDLFLITQFLVVTYITP